VERVSPGQLTEWVTEARRRWNVPGISVAVLDHGTVVAAVPGLRMEKTQVDPFTGKTDVYPSVHARPISPTEFEVGDGFVNAGPLAARVE
jgi:hypothetical protein